MILHGMGPKTLILSLGFPIGKLPPELFAIFVGLGLIALLLEGIDGLLESAGFELPIVDELHDDEILGGSLSGISSLHFEVA